MMIRNDDAGFVPDAVLLRKGARKASDIPEEALSLLQRGRLETVNLTEWLAIDHLVLLKHVLDEIGLRPGAQAMLDRLEHAAEKKIMKRIPAIANEWLNLLRQFPETDRVSIFERLAVHRSDSVRCWAAFMVGLEPQELASKLARIRRFATDDHFGVREIAWMSVRASITLDLSLSIRLLSGWVRDEDANIRRFAVEATRPHGVWAKHIAALKETPELVLPLLEPLKSDASDYVRDSVANWLNDAGKTQPDWVIQVCKTWTETSDTKETQRIVKRAQRNLNAGA